MNTPITELTAAMPDISEHLDDYFGNELGLPTSRRAAPEKIEQVKWAHAFTAAFLLSRSNRAADLEKPELEKAREMELQFFGKTNHHFIVTCIDGRNMPIIMLSHVPHVGGVMRTQAGELFGFKKRTDGGVFADPGSYEVRSITRLLTDYPGETIHYSLDSHFGCAARGEMESVAGTNTDGGLATDVRRKIIIAEGILNTRKQLLKNKKDLAEIYPQFFSYNPHAGTVTMGLELYVDTVGQAGFTDKVLSELQSQNLIVTTGEFLDHPEISPQLEQLIQPADFRAKFAQSLLSNWQAIASLYVEGKGPVYTAIYRRIESIYQKAGWTVGENFSFPDKQIPKAIIENKAKVMLKNLVTRWSIAKNTNEWPYDKHQEQAIVITEGGYAPFEGKLDVFSVFSYEDILAQHDHLYLAQRLVRGFRTQGAKEGSSHGGIKDPLGMLEGNEFVDAPVIIFNKAIIRKISDSRWEALKNINFSEVLKQIDWNDKETEKWDRSKISQLLNNLLKEQYHDVAEEIINGVYELFDRMRNLIYDYRFRDLLIDKQVLLVNLIVDQNRRPRIFVPLVV